MNCADIEILICDYVDGTLTIDRKAEMERHFAECPACAELARDSAAAVAFMERTADVEPPPELITRLLQDPPWSRGQAFKKGTRSWLAGIFGPILQPRFYMGMAMTILSLSILWQFVRPPRQLQPSDLQPSKVWAGVESRADRVWQRTVQFWESLKVVYQIQTTLREWQQQSEEQRPADERKLTVKHAPDPGKPPGDTPAGGTKK
jgi:anti-sigma factor RsiW